MSFITEFVGKVGLLPAIVGVATIALLIYSVLRGNKKGGSSAGGGSSSTPSAPPSGTSQS